MEACQAQQALAFLGASNQRCAQAESRGLEGSKEMDTQAAGVSMGQVVGAGAPCSGGQEGGSLLFAGENVRRMEHLVDTCGGETSFRDDRL